MRSIGVFIACGGVLLSVTAAYALPKQIIILRHAEKTDVGGLCAVGESRRNALVGQYLGKGAKDSLFGSEQPAAFYAVTGHTKETIEPAASSWGAPLEFPDKAYKKKFPDDWENRWTEDAAKDVLTNYDGKIVVMTWEHHRIADEDAAKYPLTLRRLLGIDKVENDWSKNWCGSNYDFFWIVDYDPNARYDPNSGAPPTPIKVTPIKQDFGGDYPADPPRNESGVPGEPEKVFEGPDHCDPTPAPSCSGP